jgi:hypothetical protein
VLLCLPWFVSLHVAVIFTVFCRAVGHFLNFFYSCDGFASSFLQSFGCSAGFFGFGNVLANCVGFPFANVANVLN